MKRDAGDTWGGRRRGVARGCLRLVLALKKESRSGAGALRAETAAHPNHTELSRRTAQQRKSLRVASTRLRGGTTDPGVSARVFSIRRRSGSSGNFQDHDLWL